MQNTSSQLCPECQHTEKETNLDITCVLNQLKSEKQRDLSPSEIRYFCLWLMSLSSYDIAFRFFKNHAPTIENMTKKDTEIIRKANNLRSEMSTSINFYVKQLMGIQDEGRRIPPRQKVISFFRASGCIKNRSLPISQSQKYFFIVEVKGKKNKIEMEQELQKLGYSIEIIRRLENE